MAEGSSSKPDPYDPLVGLPTRDANALVRVRAHTGDVPLIGFLAYAVAVCARGRRNVREIRAAERLEARINAALAEYEQALPRADGDGAAVIAVDFKARRRA